jgi:hypothetical protein
VVAIDEPPLEPRTLSGVLDDLQVRGFAEHFRVVDESRLRAIGAGSTFAPSQVAIPECYRFEGVSDPDDMSILCAIETCSGIRGTLVDAFGVYSDPMVGAFLHDVPPAPGDASRSFPAPLLTR